MDATAALAATATLVATAFAASVVERWLIRHKPHELAWAVALAMFVVASAALWWGSARGWGEVAFRLFFLFGAILNVPWLALGTVYLLGGGRRGDRVRAGLGLVSAFAAGVVLTAPLRAPVPVDGLPEGRELFGPLPRILAAVCSAGGALVLIGGAVLSIWRLLAGRGPQAGAPVSAARLALGNLLIALGTLTLSASGVFGGRLGAETAFAVTLAAGVTVLFCGFLVATEPLARSSLLGLATG